MAQILPADSGAPELGTVGDGASVPAPVTRPLEVTERQQPSVSRRLGPPVADAEARENAR
jgi:hypothetical protein